MDDDGRSRVANRGRRDHQEEERSWSASIERARRRSGTDAARVRDRRSGVLVAACAAPGATTSPSAAASAPAATAPSAAARQRTAPSASAAAAGPELRHGPGQAERLLRDGFDLPFKLSEEFTKQFPNVTWNIKQDQFTNLMTATPRLLSGDNPPDLIRLPSMVSLVKDGLLKNLDDYVTAFGWDKLPAGAARAEPGRRRRDARLRLAVRRWA